jgi:type VI secretion system secreted protein Hcp
MAMDMFLKIEGVKGESRDADAKHKGTMDLLAWSWGMSNSGTAHMGTGAGAGKVNVQDLSLTKYIDSGSPTLQLACCNGKHFPEALVTVRKAGEKPLEYLTIKMSEVMVTSVSTGGSGGEDRLTENVTLNFAKVEVTYTSQDATGKAGDPIPYGWNIAENVKV